MSNWQPIETAPKDGPDVLLFQPPRKVFLGFWDNGDWWDMAEPDHLAEAKRPTHWMPLPEPPVSS